MIFWFIFGLAILPQGFAFKIEGNLIPSSFSPIQNLKNVEYVSLVNDQSSNHKHAQSGNSNPEPSFYNNMPFPEIISSPLVLSNNNQGENKEYKMEKSIPVVLTQIQPKSTIYFQTSPVQQVIETTPKPYTENFVFNASPVNSFEFLCKPPKNEEQKSGSQGVQSQTIHLPMLQSVESQNGKAAASSQFQWIPCGQTVEIPNLIVKKEGEKLKNSQNIQLLEGGKPLAIQIPRLQIVNKQTYEGSKIDFVEAKELQTLEIPAIQFENGNKAEAHKSGGSEKSQQMATILLRSTPFCYSLN